MVNKNTYPKTRAEKMADAIASRIRFMGFKAKRDNTKVKVFDMSDKDWTNLISRHSKGLFKSVSLERINK